MLRHLPTRASGIRNRGRIILDLWKAEFFAAHQGERDLKTSRGIVRERKRVDVDRLIVQLDYPDSSHEEFDVAIVYARTDERAGAINWLESAILERRV